MSIIIATTVVELSLRFVPREYADKLLSSTQEEFTFDATVRANGELVKADYGEIKGKKIEPPDDGIPDGIVGLSRSYSGLLNRLARMKGLEARFKARIIPTDKFLDLKDHAVGLALVEVYRQTPASRRRFIHYGTLLIDKRVLLFNPLGKLEKGKVSRGDGLANRFLTLKSLSGDGWGSYLNFPVVAYWVTDREGGYVLARLDGGSVAMTVVKSYYKDTSQLGRVALIRFGDDVITTTTPTGERVEHYPTLLAGGENAVFKFYLSKKNPDLVWFGKVTVSMFKGELVVAFPPTGRSVISSQREEVTHRELGLGFVGLKVSGDPFTGSVSVVNARLPGVSLFKGDGFNAGAVFNTGVFNGNVVKVKGVLVIVSKSGRMFMKRITVQGSVGAR